MSSDDLTLILAQPCPTCGAQLGEACLASAPIPPGVDPANVFTFCAARIARVVASRN